MLERPLESGRHDADNRRGDRVDADRFADDGRVGGITRLPDVGADQRHGRRVGCIVLRKKRAATHGFDADQLAAAQSHATERGFGLLGMQERAHLLNGAMQIRSSSGAGTQVEVTIPLD